jgi:alpha-beta hydrolase superfamily lysophospholipase
VKHLGLILAAAVAMAGSAAARANDQPPRSLADKCIDTSGVDAQPFWLTASDKARLYAIEAGSGTTTVILMHQSPADLCGWLPYAETLVQAGLRVLAFDFRNYGDSGRPPGRLATAFGNDVRAAVARARADGATHVFLAGASFGGVAALTFGGSLRLAGVISMSGETRIGAMNALKGVARLRAPLLVLGSRQDGYPTSAELRALFRRAGAKDKRLVLYRGGFHGWSIVETAPYAARARALVLAWIRARS